MSLECVVKNGGGHIERTLQSRLSVRVPGYQKLQMTA